MPIFWSKVSDTTQRKRERTEVCEFDLLHLSIFNLFNTRVSISIRFEKYEKKLNVAIFLNAWNSNSKHIKRFLISIKIGLHEVRGFHYLHFRDEENDMQSGVWINGQDKNLFLTPYLRNRMDSNFSF